MKSAIRKFVNQTKPPVPFTAYGARTRGLSFNLGAGQGSRESFLRQYGVSGTVFGIISLLAEACATPQWHLYRKQPVDGRRRYSTGDQGSDQRIEVVQHAAIKLWNNPNDFHTRFEFAEGSQQHQELTGETFWILDNEIGFPTSMWYVRPDRMEPIPDPDDYLVGWYYTGPNGETVPFTNDEVILEKRPDPLDPYRGAGPVASIMPNIQQQRYATEYQRNVFLNGADPGGIITVPNKLKDRELDELIDRWRSGHRGIARAGHVGVLENGAIWTPNTHSNKDMEYANLRLNNRDELREAWRMHKAMMGTSDDVNRANAQTAQEVFVGWQEIPRLNRRRDTLNNKLLPKFKDPNVEFDYDDPSPENAEAAATELVNKANAWAEMVTGGMDPHEALEICGLPDAKMAAETAMDSGVSSVGNKTYIDLKNGKNPATKVIEQTMQDFPPDAMAWMHNATWTGPVKVPLDHIDWAPDEMENPDQEKVDHFSKQLAKGKKLKPVILVKTPKGATLKLVEGHHRYLAAAGRQEPVRAFIGAVGKEHGPWEDMHSQQYDHKAVDDAENIVTQEFSNLLQRILSDGYVPIEVGSR